MQIREQGRKVQCIRSVYDPAVQRSHQKVVASFPRYTTDMPTSGLDALTDEERQTLENWLAAKRDQHQSAHRSYVARNAEQWLGELSASLAANDPATSPEKAAAIWKAIGEVAKALRKAGHPKPKTTRKAASIPDAAQARSQAKKLPTPKGGEAKPQTAKPVKRVGAPKEGAGQKKP